MEVMETKAAVEVMETKAAVRDGQPGGRLQPPKKLESGEG